MKFCEKLRQKRSQAGYTQEELALQLGVTCRTLQNYEAGTVYPKKRELYNRLAELFGTQVDYWLTETPLNPAGEETLPVWAQAFRVRQMFLEGQMTEAELDDFMRIVQEAYWQAKDRLK
jgi:transcriptional regulator with XRE-family HTH domain